MHQVYIATKRRLAQKYIEWSFREKAEKMILGDCRKIVLDFMNVYGKKDFIAADMGAGNGYYTFWLLKQFPLKQMICLERSTKSVKKITDTAKKLGYEKKLKLFCEEIEENSIRTESVDLVMCNTLLHEFERPDSILKEFLRILKKNGYIIIIDFKDTWLGKFAGRGYIKTAHGAFSLKELKKLYQKCGITVLKAVEVRNWVVCIGRKE